MTQVLGFWLAIIATFDSNASRLKRGLYHVKKRFLYLYLNLLQQFFAVSMLFYRFRKMHNLQRSRQSAAIMPQASSKGLIFPPFF